MNAIAVIVSYGCFNQHEAIETHFVSLHLILFAHVILSLPGNSAGH